MKEELFSLVGKIAIENSAANNAIDNTTDKAQKGSSTMVGAFKKIGGAIATYFAVDKIVDFGKQCVESAAQIQAQNAQFKASFKELQDEATAAFAAVGEETGILASRLQVEGTKAFSMFKGAGMDANDALMQSERFLSLAADAAAYYDISLEEASQRVLGFAKGNFENGDAIGVFTNETQRNAAAMEQYGKKFADLTEAQKQAMSLDMIERTYQMSGALGQASREADGYENVMGNLKEAWRQFTGVIGAPLLEAVIPIIKEITNGISKLTENLPTVANNFKTYLEPIKDFFQPIVDKVKELWDALKQAWETVFPNLKAAWETVAGALKVAWEEILQPIIENLRDKFSEVISFITDNLPAISDKFNEVIDMLEKVWDEVLKPLFEVIGDFVQNTFLPKWNETFNKAKDNVSAVFKGIEWLWDTLLKPLFDAVIEFLNGVFTGNWQQAFDSLLNIVKTIFEAILTAITTVFSKIWNKVVEKLDEIKNKFSSAFNEAWETVKTTFNDIYDKVVEKISAARDFVGEAIEKMKSFFDFEWSLPSIKLPHFSVSGGEAPWGFGGKGSLPKVGVEWYAKGGILEAPTAFGINPFSGNIMAGGENGKEAVAPISELMGYVRTAVNESNSGATEILIKILEVLSDDDRLRNIFIEALLNGNFKVELDSREVGRVVKKYA